MKVRFTTVVAALALGAVLVLSGCASTPSGTERGETASGTMETVENDIRLVVISINSASQNLAALINPRQEDSVKALASYSASVDALVRSSEAYTVHTDRMGVEGRDYFDEWRIEGTKYTNPQIRTLSEQRRGELSAVCAEIAEKSVGIRGSVVEFTETTYAGSTAAVETHSGTWTQSGGTYTLTGTFFGLPAADHSRQPSPTRTTRCPTRTNPAISTSTTGSSVTYRCAPKPKQERYTPRRLQNLAVMLHAPALIAVNMMRAGGPSTVCPRSAADPFAGKVDIGYTQRAPSLPLGHNG